MDPDEIEFLGEKSIIEIVPTFNSAPAYLIGGDVGPFRASIPTTVPLWVAVNLKQQQQCKIVPPEWMDVEKLLSLKDEEKGSQSFTKMPSEHYMVEAKLILGCAPDDIPRADEIRTIIKDIWDIRMSKLRSSMDSMIKKSSMYAAIDNLTLMEINSIRPILPDALDQIYRMKSVSWKKLFGMKVAQVFVLTLIPFRAREDCDLKEQVPFLIPEPQLPLPASSS